MTASLGDISNTLTVTVKALGTNLDISNHIATVTSHFYGESNVQFSNRFTAVIYYTTNGFTNLFLSNGSQSNLIGEAFFLSNPSTNATTDVFTNTNIVAIDEDSYFQTNYVTNEVASSKAITNQFVKEVVFYEQPLTNTNWSGFDFSGANLSYLILTNYNLKDADLRNADLRNADLRQANLTNANLQNVNLSNALFITFEDKILNTDESNKIVYGVSVDANYIYVANRSGFAVEVFNKVSLAFVTNFGGRGIGNQEESASIIGIDVDDGFIYVSDFGDFEPDIEIFNKNTWDLATNFGGVFGRDNGRFIINWDVAVDNDFIYVLDFDRDDVQLFNKSTRSFVTKFSSSGSGNGQFIGYLGGLNGGGIALDDEFIYISDIGRGDVQIFNKDTNALNFVIKFGSSGTSNGQFQAARGLAVNDNFIYVVDAGRDDVQIFNKDTDALNFITKFGSSGTGGDGQFEAPEFIAVRDGFIYVTDRGTTNQQDVQIFSSSLRGARF